MAEGGTDDGPDAEVGGEEDDAATAPEVVDRVGEPAADETILVSGEFVELMRNTYAEPI